MNAAICNKITQVAYDTYYKDNKYNVSVNLYKYYKYGYIIYDKTIRILFCVAVLYIIIIIYM